MYDNGHGDDNLIRIIAEVQDFAENPCKRRHIAYDHGDQFPEGIRVGYKRAIWKDIFAEIKGEIWLRVVESGPYEQNLQPYCHACRQVIQARKMATVHPW